MTTSIIRNIMLIRSILGDYQPNQLLASYIDVPSASYCIASCCDDILQLNTKQAFIQSICLPYSRVYMCFPVDDHICPLVDNLVVITSSLMQEWLFVLDTCTVQQTKQVNFATLIQQWEHLGSIGIYTYVAVGY